MSEIRLRYEEKIYDVELKNNTYKVSIISDWETGDSETVVMKYNSSGELVVPTQKQREAVLIYFDNHKHED
jgi:hypothetical protein